MTVDELAEYGMQRMDEGEIEAFLSSHSVGVLGLPTEGAPSLRPMSFGYDGDETLYLLYVVGSESRKAALSDRATVARFLVYTAETAFNWRSVLLTGHIDRVPDDEVTTVTADVEMPWRPDLFRRASDAERTAVYRFEITDRSGIEHLGLPPAFEEAGDEA
ncbi:pyridoxamine 5'-phosphate oxidase family protein [Haloplanus aerogenes]|uniref:Nitroimidazol reductase NimA-like FMN-containing flavoprotein (Pyridoxamine 5'-phosphate oxidase superfamily) n=1 Tax=Haloplanus aerogenes TaxID=660522 RepID=A0A3M0CTF3_9EURY|nr:pyridoxamine 5'-phosphate oxidase family protein [Haloplanus aerogenes]AZH26534.1 pyridoxamine 5'-phosphate oxidase family protein [Haloplanus aerogenes]RMB12762.1 nitroimidazol reductase NimA-like FMN-containing flavoprotein (pyridoxamine 5'-phosphate oxidase superfamily) [Haloplanus aerogenes]